MKTKKTYLAPHDFKAARWVQISAVKKEIIDGRPQIVLYFFGEKRGLPLTRKIADDLTKAFGPHPLVEKFNDWLQ